MVAEAKQYTVSSSDNIPYYGMPSFSQISDHYSAYATTDFTIQYLLHELTHIFNLTAEYISDAIKISPSTLQSWSSGNVIPRFKHYYHVFALHSLLKDLNSRSLDRTRKYTELETTIQQGKFNNLLTTKGKTMKDEINVTEAPTVIYQRGQNDGEKQPEFKPGTTPHTQYGDEMLNANVPWHEIVGQILTRNYTIGRLAEEVKTSIAALNKILKEDFSELNFRTGARILGVHCVLFPETFA